MENEKWRAEEVQKFYEDNYSKVLYLAQRTDKGKTEALDLLGNRLPKQILYIDGYVDKKERVCRFCGKKVPETIFSKDAHAISEFFGNKTIFLCNECNTCNEVFSKFEDALAKLLMPVHSLIAVKGKKGSPTLKSKNDELRIDYVSGVDSETGQRYDNEHIKISIDGSKCELNDFFDDNMLSMQTQAFVPLNAYKALCKIALSTMPQSIYNNYAKFKEIEKWIKESEYSRTFNEHVLHGYISKNIEDLIVEGYVRNDLIIEGFTRKNDIQNIPPYIFSIIYKKIFICFGFLDRPFPPTPVIYYLMERCSKLSLSSSRKQNLIFTHTFKPLE